MKMKFPAMVRLSVSIVAFCLSGSSVCHADTPTAEALCHQRNAASCEMNGLKFFIEDDCPKGAKILRPKGHEDCEHISENANSKNNVPADAVAKQAVQVAAAVPAMPRKEAEGGWMENPFVIVAVIGLLQGLISRAGVGPFIIVALVMPVIVTWVRVSGAPVHAVGAEYWGNAGLELLKIFACSMLGWGVGLAAHRGLLKLLYR